WHSQIPREGVDIRELDDADDDVAEDEEATKCPYIEGEPKKCHWNYPRQFQETMQQGDDSYPLYRRRDNGIELWDDHYESLSKDYSLDCASVERVQNMVLTDISSILKSMGRSLSDFDLPNITADVRSYAFGCREVHEECSIVVQEEDILARHSINTDQKNAYDTIMRHVDADSLGVFLLMAQMNWKNVLV
ncbi:hypothetical protein Tco_1412170, partial [Tanacetum coccineum]